MRENKDKIQRDSRKRKREERENKKSTSLDRRQSVFDKYFDKSGNITIQPYVFPKKDQKIEEFEKFEGNEILLSHKTVGSDKLQWVVNTSYLRHYVPSLQVIIMEGYPLAKRYEYFLASLKYITTLKTLIFYKCEFDDTILFADIINGISNLRALSFFGSYIKRLMPRGQLVQLINDNKTIQALDIRYICLNDACLDIDIITDIGKVLRNNQTLSWVNMENEHPLAGKQSNKSSVGIAINTWMHVLRKNSALVEVYLPKCFLDLWRKHKLEEMENCLNLNREAAARADKTISSSISENSCLSSSVVTSIQEIKLSSVTPPNLGLLNIVSASPFLPVSAASTSSSEKPKESERFKGTDKEKKEEEEKEEEKKEIFSGGNKNTDMQDTTQNVVVPPVTVTTVRLEVSNSSKNTLSPLPLAAPSSLLSEGAPSIKTSEEKGDDSVILDKTVKPENICQQLKDEEEKKVREIKKVTAIAKQEEKLDKKRAKLKRKRNKLKQKKQKLKQQKQELKQKRQKLKQEKQEFEQRKQAPAASVEALANEMTVLKRNINTLGRQFQSLYGSVPNASVSSLVGGTSNNISSSSPSGPFGASPFSVTSQQNFAQSPYSSTGGSHTTPSSSPSFFPQQPQPLTRNPSSWRSSTSGNSSPEGSNTPASRRPGNPQQNLMPNSYSSVSAQNTTFSAFFPSASPLSPTQTGNAPGQPPNSSVSASASTNQFPSDSSSNNFPAK